MGHTTPVRPHTSDYRPEIQGLRCLAVALVVGFHLWPHRLSGGFVGVDVFFVISGFLITAHLEREWASTGTIGLRRFWARRIRRLLPASLLVLAVSVVATVTLLPASIWADTARQITASALYVQNWALATDAVDYLAADTAATVVQHYWSLSVEEQFYLIWPVIMLGLGWIATHLGRRRTGPSTSYRVVVAGLSTLGVASLAYSVVATADNQASAYFVTPTRGWEFAAGGLLALATAGVGRDAPTFIARHRRIGSLLTGTRTPLGWFGLAAIGFAALTYDERSAFPGYIAALPVLGTVAVLAAGSSTLWWSAARWLSTAPARVVGDLSYAIYLWHWPLIIIWPYVTGVPLRTGDTLAILAITVVASRITMIAVENPLRTGSLLSRRPWRAYAFAVVGMAVVVAGSVAITTELDRRSAEAARVLATRQADPCYGPKALTTSDCGAVSGDGTLTPAPEVVMAENTTSPFAGCQQGRRSSDVLTCTIGYTGDDPAAEIALVGDSHATHWFAAFDEMGRDRHWRIHTFTKVSCPLTTAVRVLDEPDDAWQQSCAVWSEDVLDRLAAMPEVTTIVTTARGGVYEYAASPGHPLADPGVDGFQETFSAWSSAGRSVVVLGPVPPTNGTVIPTCLETATDATDCATERPYDTAEDTMTTAAHAIDDPAVRYVDVTDLFCDATTCYPAIGGVIVYRDSSHLADAYARALAPALAALMDAAAQP